MEPMKKPTFTKGETVQIWDWLDAGTEDTLPQHGKLGVIVRQQRKNLFTVAVPGFGLVEICTDWLRKV